MATVRKNPKKTGKGWQVRYDVYVNGKRKQVTKIVHVKGKKEAIKIGNQLEAEVSVSIVSKGDPTFTLAELLEVYKKGYIEDPLNNLEHQTRYAETTKISTIQKHIGDLVVSEITIDDIENFYRQLLIKGNKRRDHRLRQGKKESNPNSYISRIHGLLKRAVREGVRRGYIEHDFMKDVKTARREEKKSKPRPIGADVLQELLKATIENAYEKYTEAMIHTLVYTGARRGECLGLRWFNLNIDRAPYYLRVSDSHHESVEVGIYHKADSAKTVGGFRDIPLCDDYVEYMREYREAQKLRDDVVWNDYNMVFSRPSGIPCKPDRLTKEIRRISDTINRPDINARALRHAFAGCLVMSIPEYPKEMQRIMGHKKIQTTLDIYADVMSSAPGFVGERINSYMNGLESLSEKFDTKSDTIGTIFEENQRLY